MQIVVKARRVVGVAQMGLLLIAIALALPSTASAADVSCKGHISKAQDDEDFENALGYTFACTGRIVGYMIVSNRELDTFDTEIEVFDAAGALVSADSFVCEGEIPGSGIGCYGKYTTNNTVRSTFSVSGAKACAEPRVNAKLVVVLETLDVVTGVGKKSSLGEMAGPFNLGRPQKCPKSTVFAGLFAEIAEIRARIMGTAS